MKSFTKTLFVLTVFFGVLSTDSNNFQARGRILQQHNINGDESKLPLPFPNPFGGGFTFPGAGSTGEWFPGQGGSNNPGAGSTGDWFPGQGGGSNIPGPHHFCSLPGIKCATAHQDEVIPAADNNNNYYKKTVIGTKVDDGRVIGGSP